MKRIVFAAALIFANIGFCGDHWWSFNLSDFPLMTINGGNNSITLQPKDSNTRQVTDLSATSATTQNVNQIYIYPPSGREKEWQSMILTAISTGMGIRITSAYVNDGVNHITYLSNFGTGNPAYITLVPAGM